MEDGFFNEKDASKIMKHILSSVNYCHKHDIVHRDLKPENVMLEKGSDTYHELKVIDFGTG